MNTRDILGAAIDKVTTAERLRERPAGEQVMDRAVDAFKALTGSALSARDGWLFLASFKMAQTATGVHLLDDYIQIAVYASRAGEAAEDASRIGS